MGHQEHFLSTAANVLFRHSDALLGVPDSKTRDHEHADSVV